MFECISHKNDIALFADDTKIWREIKISEDNFILQSDIDKLFAWSNRNKMKFHPSKVKYCPSIISEIYSITYHSQYSSIE